MCESLASSNAVTDEVVVIEAEIVGVVCLDLDAIRGSDAFICLLGLGSGQDGGSSDEVVINEV